MEDNRDVLLTGNTGRVLREDKTVRGIPGATHQEQGPGKLRIVFE